LPHLLETGLPTCARRLNAHHVHWNAKNWYYNARKSKYATGRTPRKFAVMQSTAGYYGLLETGLPTCARRLNAHHVHWFLL
jgi:hypothetical protein